jgi:hypothetical protein
MSLFKIVTSQILTGVNQIIKQGDVMASMVLDPIMGLLRDVSGGSWKGDGADRFYTELTTEVLPMLGQLNLFNRKLSSGIKKSHDHIENAIQKSITIALSLNDVFSEI